jgi:galactonate dehydratase
MKITGVQPWLVKASTSYWGEYLFVEVTTDEGISGWGEITSTTKIANRALCSILKQVGAQIAGEDPSRIERLWHKLFRSFTYMGSRGAACECVSAIDIALWDIRGKALNVPVYELLGGRSRDRVVCYPHCNELTIEGLLESARRAVAEGWRFVRWGLPPEGEVLEPRVAIRTAVKQFDALRTDLGDDVELCMDVHTRIDPADAVTLLRAVEPYRPFFMEDPVRAEDLTALRRVRQRTAVPIAAGEQLHSKWQFRPLIEEDLIDYARVDLCLGGGLTEAKKIAAMAEAHHIKLATHNPLSPLSTAACLHLNLSCPNVGVQEQPARPGTALTDVFPVQMEWEDGYLLAPTRPGLGIEFDREAARAHPFRMVELPYLRRADGAFTNW